MNRKARLHVGPSLNSACTPPPRRAFLQTSARHHPTPSFRTEQADFFFRFRSCESVGLHRETPSAGGRSSSTLLLSTIDSIKAPSHASSLHGAPVPDGPSIGLTEMIHVTTILATG